MSGRTSDGEGGRNCEAGEAGAGWHDAVRGKEFALLTPWEAVKVHDSNSPMF